jgi:small basic protein (TIGR04137 family)
MSVHKSLKTKGLGTKHRNVLSREERIAKLREEGRFDDAATSPFGLAKVRSIKVKKG